MKNFKLWLTACIFPLLTNCGKAPASVSSEKNEKDITGKWQLESVIQEKDTIRKPGRKNSKFDVSLTFKDHGELEATSSANYLTGFYETAQLNAIHLGGDGTEKEETSWGNIFVNALPHVNVYDLRNNRLVLFCDDNKQLVFNRVRSL